MSESQLHELEPEFGPSAHEILTVILNRNRCRIAVRGAIAEAHLLRELRRLQDSGAIESFQDFDRDGYPDVKVVREGKSFLIECKNVERKIRGQITVDFQRTRNPIDTKWERYYLPTEFDVLAACLYNRTERWEFRYAATKNLQRHRLYPDRLSNRVKLPDAPAIENDAWSSSLVHVLEQIQES